MNIYIALISDYYAMATIVINKKQDEDLRKF